MVVAPEQLREAQGSELWTPSSDDVEAVLKTLRKARQGEPIVDEINPGPTAQTDLPRPIGPMDPIVEQEPMPSEASADLPPPALPLPFESTSDQAPQARHWGLDETAQGPRLAPHPPGCEGWWHATRRFPTAQISARPPESNLCRSGPDGMVCHQPRVRGGDMCIM